MKRFGSIIERISNIGGYLSGWLVLLMMFLIMFEVFMRYIVGKPPIIADEFAAYMLVAMSFLGGAYTWRQKGHVRITFLVQRLPPRAASWTRLVTLVIAFIFAIVLSQASSTYLGLSFRLHLASPTWTHSPQQGPHMTLVIGFILLALLILVEIVKAIMSIRSGKQVEERTK